MNLLDIFEKSELQEFIDNLADISGCWVTVIDSQPAIMACSPSNIPFFKLIKQSPLLQHLIKSPTNFGNDKNINKVTLEEFPGSDISIGLIPIIVEGCGGVIIIGPVRIKHPDDRDCIKLIEEHGLLDSEIMQTYEQLPLLNQEEFKRITRLIEYNFHSFVASVCGSTFKQKKIVPAKLSCDLTQFAVDNAADAAFWMGPDAKFIYVNKKACQSLGYSKEELLGMAVYDIDPHISREEWIKHWRKVTDQKAFTFKSHHKAKDGSIFPVEISINYLKHNGCEYNFAFARDISQREKARQDWETIFQAIGHPTLILDPDHRILDANEAAKKALQLNGDIVGKTCFELFHLSTKSPKECPLKKMLKTNLMETETMEIEAMSGVYLVSCTPVFDVRNELQKIIHIATDITDRRVAEQSLKRERDLVSQIMETSPVGISVLDKNGHIIFANTQLQKVLRLLKDDITHRKFNSPEWRITDYEGNLYPEDKLPFRVVMDTQGPVHDLQHAIEMPGGERIFLSVNAAPLYDNQGSFDGVVTIVDDVTHKVISQEALVDSEEKFRSIFENANDGMMYLDPGGNIININQKAADIFGISKVELIGRHFSKMDIFREREIPLLQRNFDKALKHKQLFVEIQLTNRRGERLFLECSTTHIGHHSKLQGILAIIRDGTERKIADEKLRASLVEKEILLKEIHHRVKNNLQIISSLINLQSRSIKDKKMLEVLKESRERITSIALVHEKLYGSKDLTKIDFSQYVHSLGQQIQTSYDGNRRGIILNIHKNNISLPIDIFIPLGLIINELLSNAYKYAFPANVKQGTISVDLQHREADQLRLVVTDDGVGFPSHLDIKKADTLGLKLVTLLAENQLGGQLTVNTSNGTEFVITFSSPESNNQ